MTTTIKSGRQSRGQVTSHGVNPGPSGINQLKEIGESIPGP